MNKKYIKNFHISFFQDIIAHTKKQNLPYILKKYKKKQLIALANSMCDKVGFVLDGEINIEHVLKDGKKVTISTIGKFDIFGEILIFSDQNKYPYNIVANEVSEIVFLNKETLLRILSQDINLLEAYLYHTSQSYMKLNKYIKLINQKTIEKKIAYFLIHYGNINKEQLIYKINTKAEIADFLGVERQSLIRELNKLKEKNVIFYDKNHIYVRNLYYIKNLIN